MHWGEGDENDVSADVGGIAHSICLFTSYWPTDQCRANARLIAAAPELLEALADLIGLAKAAMGEANRDGAEYEIEEELSTARAAIAKAEGKPSEQGDIRA